MDFVDSVEQVDNPSANEEYDTYCMVCQSTTVALQPVDSYKAEFPNELTLREKLRELSKNEVAPSASICNDCSYRSFETWDFKLRLETTNTKNTLGFKIKMLRQKLREMSEKADVYIVVGKNGDSLDIEKGNTLMVTRDSLNATADDDFFEPNNMCNRCTDTFPNMSQQEEHLATHQPSDPFICHKCQFIFTDQSMYDAHIDLHKRFSCFVCGFYGDSVKDLGDHVCMPKCVTCNREFPNRVKLSAHAREHHSSGAAVGPYSCSVCFQRFRTVDKLLRHKHREPRDHFVCGYNFCLARFDKKEALTKHVRTMHRRKPKIVNHEIKKSTKKLKYEAVATCVLCKAEFTDIHDMWVHQAEEHGTICSECGNNFMMVRTRNRHMKTVHPGVQIPPDDLTEHKIEAAPEEVEIKVESNMLEEQEVVDAESIEYLDDDALIDEDIMDV